MKVAILVSGRGSNLIAICEAKDRGACRIDICCVVSDRKRAAALEFAASRTIPTRVVPLRKGDDRARWNVDLADVVSSFEPDLVVLAGFMRVLGTPLLERFPARIINVHPALLPSFPGHSGPEDALNGGVRISGCTVHVVDDGVDTGPIIAQAAVPVLDGDTPEALHARIQVQEHQLLPSVIDRIASGEISLEPLRVDTRSTDPDDRLVVPGI